MLFMIGRLFTFIERFVGSQTGYCPPNSFRRYKFLDSSMQSTNENDAT